MEDKEVSGQDVGEIDDLLIVMNAVGDLDAFLLRSGCCQTIEDCIFVFLIKSNISRRKCRPALRVKAYWVIPRYGCDIVRCRYAVLECLPNIR